MTHVYSLYHLHTSRSQDQQVLFIGAYGSRPSALRAIERLRKLPSFKKSPKLIDQKTSHADGFNINWGPAWVIIAAAWVLLTSTTRLEAQTPAPPTIAEPPTHDVNSLAQIEVIAQRRDLKKRVQAFIAAVTPPTYADSLLRWNQAICPVIIVPPPDQSARILTHVSQIATAAGVAIRPKPCTPNCFIAAWDYPEPLLTAWRKRDLGLFGRTSQKTVDAFINSPRPVRVWYNTVTAPPEASATFAETAAIAASALDAVQAFALRYFDEVQSFSSVIVVIDTKRAAGVNLEQLSDYIAVVGLSKINLDAEIG